MPPRTGVFDGWRAVLVRLFSSSSLLIPLIKWGLGTFLCTLSVLGIGWIGAHRPLPLSVHLPLPDHCGLALPVSWQCSATCGEGIQQRQVVCRTNANSLGQCEGDKPDTLQACSLPACRGEPDRMGRGRPGRPSSSRPNSQPSLYPGPLEIPSIRGAPLCSQEISRTLP